MLKELKDYIIELKKEYYRCVDIATELHENRSENYYYHTRAVLLEEIVYDLDNIIIKVGDVNEKTVITDKE